MLQNKLKSKKVKYVLFSYSQQIFLLSTIYSTISKL